MADYAVTDSRSDEYRARAQDFFNSWGLDRSRPEQWSGSRDHFSEDDKDLFLRGDHLPGSMQNDEGFYMGRQTRDLSKMNEDEYYTGAQKDQVNQAMTELGMDENDSELKSGRVLSHMFQKHMDGLTEPASSAPTVDSKPLANAKGLAQNWGNHSQSGARAEETFNPSEGKYDARNNNSPKSDAVLNSYKEDFANNFSPDEASLTNAFAQTALNQQGGDRSDMPSRSLQQEEDEFLQKAKGQNLLSA